MHNLIGKQNTAAWKYSPPSRINGIIELEILKILEEYEIFISLHRQTFPLISLDSLRRPKVLLEEANHLIDRCDGAVPTVRDEEELLLSKLAPWRIVLSCARVTLPRRRRWPAAAVSGANRRHRKRRSRPTHRMRGPNRRLTIAAHVPEGQITYFPRLLSANQICTT